MLTFENLPRPRARTPSHPESLAALILACGLVLAACQTDTEAESAQASPDAGQYLAIDWHDGTVEEAFAEAERSAKPLFLYWGAVWCPPCNLMKSTLFQQPEFIARTRDFVAVYLDGDTERAQVWGEKHDAVGYPTLIVFDSRRPPDDPLAQHADSRVLHGGAGRCLLRPRARDRAGPGCAERRAGTHRRRVSPARLPLLVRRPPDAGAGTIPGAVRPAGRTGPPGTISALARRVQALRLSEAIGAGGSEPDSGRYAHLIDLLEAGEHDPDILMMFSGKLSGAFAELAPDPAQQAELRGALAWAIESVLANPTGSKSAPIFSLELLLELERVDDAEAPPSPDLLARIVAAAEQGRCRRRNPAGTPEPDLLQLQPAAGRRRA